MLLDSGTTSHMTPYVHLVKNKEYCNVSISLADDSTISADAIGVRPVTWQGDNGPIEVTLSDTLVTPDAAVSLLSVPALVNKGIAVLFMPGKAVLIDTNNNMNVLGYSKQSPDGLFYSEDDQDKVPVKKSRGHASAFRAMMALAEKVKHD